MAWTVKEQKDFLAEAKTAAEKHKDRKIIRFKCPLCGGIAHVKRNGDNIEASCKDCIISV